MSRTQTEETVTISRTLFDEMIRAQSGQFVVGQIFPGHQPTLLTQDQYLFYSGVRALRQTVRELKEGGAQVKVRYIPEIVVYDVTPSEGMPYQLFTCPVEVLGIAPEVREKKRRGSAEAEATKAQKLAEREAAKAQKAAEREAAKAAKKAEKEAAAKAKAEQISASEAENATPLAEGV